MESAVLTNLLLKEKIAAVLCIFSAILLLVTGVYDFFINEVAIQELVTTVGAFLLIFSVGLMPKMFFSPLTNILKPENIPTLVNPKLLLSLQFTGLLLCLVSVIWQMLL
jgi:hypothetical protein